LKESDSTGYSITRVVDPANAFQIMQTLHLPHVLVDHDFQENGRTTICVLLVNVERRNGEQLK
jgi:hypothetical protein